ncbi:MAG: transketolase C-terminal domain-containing protein [bacterium]
MVEKNRVAKTGNEAMAEAMRQINPDVVAAYPITPATEIVQIFSQFVSDGIVRTEFVAVESEHSAMSATIGASAAGSRAMTATSSQGLALMHEMLYIAAALRLPIVMPEVNRALSAPINIHCDHSDTMGSRDAGWIQLFSENSQEAYDNLIQAVKIAEKAYLPVMVTIDGFIISHAMEDIKILTDDEVQKYIGEFNPAYKLLDTDKPITVGALDFTDFYFEHKRSQSDATRKSKEIVLKVSTEFSQKYGGNYSFFESYKLDDAEMAVIVLGSTAGTAKVAVDRLRDKGVKAGLLKIRMFRPFPEAEISQALSKLKAVAVMDRSESMNGIGGPVFEEIRSALYDNESKPQVMNVIYGLGGRDIFVEDIEGIFSTLQDIISTGKVSEKVQYVGVRDNCNIKGGSILEPSVK